MILYSDCRTIVIFLATSNFGVITISFYVRPYYNPQDLMQQQVIVLQSLTWSGKSHISKSLSWVYSLGCSTKHFDKCSG